MLLIVCPYCGARNSDEFIYNGETVRRPDVGTTGAAEWRGYLYMRTNENGWVAERWFHESGCRRFVIVERHTSSNEIRSVTALKANRT